MTLASFIHDAIFGCPLTTEPRPAINGQAAWNDFQARHHERIAKEKARHGRVNDARAEQQRELHEALRRVG